jgi:hypothetical protein
MAWRPPEPDLVRRENARPGTREWVLTRPRVDPESRFRCPWIEGWWSHGLAEPPGYVRPTYTDVPRGPDARARRITRNVLERMRATRRPDR